MAPIRVHSGIQKQVLSLYREALRAARRLEPTDASTSASTYIRSEFRSKASSVDRLDFQRVEHLLRAARKKIDSLSGAQVSGFRTSA
jgi:hypothetical protein